MTIELELPGLYVDSVVLDVAPARLLLGNRDPEPGEGRVPVTQVISLSVLDTGAVPGISVAATRVYVQGVLAYDGGAGGFQPGFVGAGSALSVSPSVVRISVNLLSFFGSFEVVTVHVLSSTTDAAATLDQTYSFTCVDATPPMLISAVAQALRRVRLEFSEPVEQGAGTSLTDALNPANYEFTRTSSPAVNVFPQLVTAITDAIVDVQTDMELSPGASYQVLVANVVDALGNTIAPPYNVQDFDAFAPEQPAGRRFDIFGMMPALNRGEDLAGTGDLLRFLSCLQEPASLLLNQIDHFVDIFDPDYAPQPFLDRMLLDLGNPFRFDLRDVDKRRLAQVLVAIYKQKGTGQGVINAIRFFVSLDVTIDSYNGTVWILGEDLLGDTTELGPSISFLRYAFEVLAPQTLTAVQRDQINQIVRYMKPAHTHYMRLVEPVAPDIIDHLELGLSELGDTWQLH